MRFVAELPSVHLDDFDAFFRAMWKTFAVKYTVMNDDGKEVDLYPGTWSTLEVMNFEQTGRLYAPVLDGQILMTIAVAHYNRANLFIDVTEMMPEGLFFFPNVTQWLKDKFAARELEPQIEAPLSFNIWKANGFPSPTKDLLLELNQQESIKAEGELAFDEELDSNTSMTEEELLWMERIMQAGESGNVVQYCLDRNIPRSSLYVWIKRLENHPRMIKRLKKYIPKT